MIFKNLIAAVLYEMINFILKHQDFFEKPTNSRKQIIDQTELPHPFKVYLEQVEGAQFILDLKLILSFLKNPPKTKIQNHPFFNALCELFAHSFSIRLDLMSDYATAKENERRAVVKKLIAVENSVGKALKKLLLNNSYQELSNAIQALCQKTWGNTYTLLQFPCSINPELKKEIRGELRQTDSTLFPIFQVNRQLIGGFRIFKGGKTTDYSWIRKVLKLKNYASKGI